MSTAPHTMQPGYVPCSQAQKTAGRTVVAHISDLHFTSATDAKKEDDWTALAADLRNRKVDILAVTGDLVDSSVRDNFRTEGVRRAFVNVRDFLFHLCEALDIDPATGLSVVPGNHDVRVKGVLSPDSRYRPLRWVKQRLLRPHYDLFYEMMGDYYRPKFLPGLRCCIFTFDSNTPDWSLNFASGRITNDDIVEFFGTCERMAAENEEVWPRCTRIALLHHHPMPIAATELKAGFLDAEAYHLLKNAGLFMTEMVRRKVDLVLHGHKHYPALSRATFPARHANGDDPADGEESHTISVLAAGSPSRHGQPHSTYNLITISDNGNVSLERREREAVGYSRGVSLPSLTSYEEVRRAQFARRAEQLDEKTRVGVYTRIDVINGRSGDDDICERFERLGSATREPQARLWGGFVSSSGFAAVPRIEENGHSIRWEKHKAERGLGHFVLDPPVSDQPVSFTAQTTVFNAMYFNKQDRRVVSKDDVDENVKAWIGRAYDLLTLKVHFPPGFAPINPRVHVYEDETGVRDPAEERYASRRFTSFKDDNTVVLIVDRPLPRYYYKIVWSLPETEREEVKLREFEGLRAEEIKGLLLGLCGEAERAGRVRLALAELKQTINEVVVTERREGAPAGGRRIGAPDLEIAVHTHHRESGRLVCVAALSTPEAERRLLARTIKVGDTVIGQAYRRREHFSWISGQQTGEDSADFLEYDHEQRHTAILSIPLFHPLEGGIKIGVLTLATRSKSSPMLSLLGQNPGKEDTAAFGLLVSKAMTWYAKRLLAAIEEAGPPPAPAAPAGG